MLQSVGQCFGFKIYAVTSNAGEIALLIGVSIVVSLVQRDLVIASSYANFLHKSNEAFAKVPVSMMAAPNEEERHATEVGIHKDLRHHAHPELTQAREQHNIVRFDLQVQQDGNYELSLTVKDETNGNIKVGDISAV